MKQIKLIIPVIMLLAACSKDNVDNNPGASASSTQNLKQSNTRPFNAEMYTTVDPNTAIPPTSCSGDLPGFANPGIFIHGSASHMGDFIPELSRIQDVSCNLSFATGLLTTNFSGQLTASNGDLIYVSGLDTIDASNYLGGISTAGTITGTWNITGGTGRFDGASGSFTIDGPVDFATTSFSCVCVGTITY